MSHEWITRAACVTADRALFFPTFTGGEFRASIYDDARAFCRRCEVAEQCLEAILPHEGPGWRFGMFGGMTPAERDRRFKGVQRCKGCGVTFSGRRMGYCSDECRDEARQETIERSRVKV